MSASVLLAGRRDGTTHREVALLASLPAGLRLIGGLAVMCRVGTPHRATVDLDAVARDLDAHHEALVRLALTAAGGGQYRFAGDLDLDVIEVAPVPHGELLAQLTAGGQDVLSDLELNVLAHTFAHDTATAMDISAVDDDDGAVLARAPGRLVASPVGLVAMKATAVPLRASSKPEKRASDLYDLGRILVSRIIEPGAMGALPEPLRQAVAARLHQWFVDPAGRDRTFRDVRRFDEPRLDLDEASDAVEDLATS